ncbi:MAG TPA: ATP-binding protein, partial [Myxococcota bacterium]|nr:ATP-binding protein [Myxococcota bacterium]
FIPYKVPMHVGGEIVVRERYWSATHAPLRDEKGRVTAVLQHTIDVTELHALRRASADERADYTQWGAAVLGRARNAEADKVIADQERLHLLRVFRQTPGFMTFVRGPRHIFEIANDSYMRLIGRTDDPHNIVGRSVTEVLPEVASQGYIRLLDRVFSTGVPYYGHAERVVLRRDDVLEEVFLDFAYQPVRDAAGVVSGILVHGYDITAHVKLERERKDFLASERAARAEAERANQAKDDFLAMVSHELRTPLNAIMGYLHLMRDGRLPPDKQARAIDALDRNARAQALVINDLLDISRIIAGKLELVRTDTHLAALVGSALDSVRPTVETKKQTLTADLDESIYINVDESRMHQIVLNLLSNAVKFTPEGGVIHVSVQRCDGEVCISVRDNGVGIDPSFLPRVFDRFYQADRISTRAHGGLGLGLAIVRHLVELHGGRVTAESAGRGAGALFTVRLRDARAHGLTRSPSKPITLGDALTGLHVLVVDDEPDAREVVRGVLERAGAQVSLAGSASEGRIKLAGPRVDVVVSDIGMPSEDGYTFMRRLRSEQGEHRVPALALSAYARQS